MIRVIIERASTRVVQNSITWTRDAGVQSLNMQCCKPMQQGIYIYVCVCVWAATGGSHQLRYSCATLYNSSTN